MLRRPYGNTGETLSIIGLGGIVVAQMTQAEADTTVRGAFDRGITYYDVAPTYMDAEERLGPALAGIRDQVFLACKTEKRDRVASREALHASLRKLQTDHFDLYQLHGLQNLQDAEACFAPGGAMETLIEAREKGLARYLGFSAHSVEAALFCMEQFEFDSVLFPFTYPAYHNGFGPQVLQAARDRGMAVLALKAMARGPWPEGADRTTYPKCWYEPHTQREEAALALRWTLSLPVTAAVPPGDARLFWLAVEIAERFEPLSAEEMQVVAERARALPPLFQTA